MKLSDWAREKGIHYTTAYRWFKSGKLPGATQVASGTILVDTPITKLTADSKPLNVIYCRVSNQSRRKELDYQVQRCEEFARAKGLELHKTFKEVASGMNDNRKQLWKMIDSSPTTIIVENKDRLTRFGFHYLQNLLAKLNCQIIVINETKEDEQDLMKDLVSIITSFCCRLYGLRRAQNKINKIKLTLAND